jgi:hypothetical protein
MPVVGKCEEWLSCASTSTKERCILNNLLAAFKKRGYLQFTTFMKYKVSPPPSLMTLGSEPMPIPWIVNISPRLLIFERTYVICLKDCKVSQPRKPLS